MELSDLVPPQLSEEESFHVFLSYSHSDQDWTDDLIEKLEQSGLKVCNHERDFTGGCDKMRNMSECIRRSQKMLVLLSEESVKSRWCLLEANMPLFEDSLRRKPIVPILLERDVSMPLHLKHLTYLDAKTPDFTQRLLKLLFTPNQDLQGCTVVPYRPLTLYNGQALEPLTATNEAQLNPYDCGLWNDAPPLQLQGKMQQPQRYSDAMKIINKVSKKKVKYRSISSKVTHFVMYIFILLILAALIGYTVTIPVDDSAIRVIRVTTIMITVAAMIWAICKMTLLRITEPRRIKRKLQEAIGKANYVLFEEKFLMGFKANSKLLLVHVNVDGCRQELSGPSQDDKRFKKHMYEYSCAYTCCLSNRHFPTHSFQPAAGHLEGSVCFCQYVNYRRDHKNWFDCCWKKL